MVGRQRRLISFGTLNPEPGGYKDAQMKVLESVVWRAVMCFVSIIPIPTQSFGQASGPPEDAPQPALPNNTNLPILRNANENSWLVSLEYYAPQPGYYRHNRDIDVSDIRVSRAWHFRWGLEFQLDAFFLRATGNRTAPSFAPSPPQEPSGAYGLGVGPVFRWNFLQFKRLRLFADADPDIFFTNHDFPAGGSKYNFFLRAGAGAAFRLTNSLWVESRFLWAHISNGQGIVAGNPAWQGRGVAVGVRYTSR